MRAPRLPRAVLAALLCGPGAVAGGAPQAEAPEKGAARTLVRAFTLRESSGRVEARVVARTVLPRGFEPPRTERDFVVPRPQDTLGELEALTPGGSFEVRTESYAKPDAAGNLIRSEIRAVATGRKVTLGSGGSEQNHDKPDLAPERVFKRMILRAGEVSLEVSELKSPELLAGKLSAKELAAFREAVPPALVGFCELLVRASDLLEVDDVALLLATVAAPEGTRMDATRQGWYVTDEKTSVRSVPIQQEPP
ncbi:hypothetical protein FBQ97_15100, partial [Acidobacteria bacterium ACD]|nr:hypothetical protein [Acidobacteria bacterium ACD]